MNNKLSNIFKGDKVIWMVFFFLCIISIVEVYSASSQLTYGTDSYLGPVSKHFSIMAVGFVLMLLTQNIKCRYFKIVTPFMLIISILTLIYVFIAGHATNGAQRWIPLFGFQFQPSELAKGTMILATAQILSAMQTENGADRQAFKYILIVGATIIPLIFVENFSTAALLSAVVFMMMVIGRVPTQQLGKLLGVSVTLVGLFIAVVLIFGKEEKPLDKDKKLTEKVELATDDKAKDLSQKYSTGSVPGRDVSLSLPAMKRCWQKTMTSTKMDRWDMPTSPSLHQTLWEKDPETQSHATGFHRLSRILSLPSSSRNLGCWGRLSWLSSISSCS